MPISLRFPIALVLSTICLAVAACADDQVDMYASALRELRPLAEQGDATSQYNLGVLYANGQGVPKDYVQARQWYEQAATQDLALAQYNLGGLYAEGHGVPQDYVQALMWHSLAAANGHKDAATIRDAIATEMIPAQIAEAQELVREWTQNAEQGSD